MRIRTSLAACIVPWLALVSCSTGARADDLQLDANDWTTILPELKDAPSPEWVKPGVQLSYYYATATVRGSYHNYSLDPKGDFVDDQGNRYSQSDTPTGSAHGFAQTNILAVEKNVVVGQINTSIFTPGGPLSAVSGISAVASGGANETWLGPEARKKVLALNSPGFKALRGPFALDNQQYQAIFISWKTGSSSRSWVYDEKTGILLRSGVASKGASPTVVGRGEIAGPSTLLAIVNFAGMRTLDLPWAKADAPDWAARFKRITYRGAVTAGLVGGSGSSSFPLEIRMEPRRRGAAWVETALHLTQNNGPAFPPTNADSLMMSSNASLLGLYVPAASLRELKEGQVLDRDPVTKFTYTVSGPARGPGGRALVVIRETGPIHMTDCGYDRETGLLVIYTKTDRSTVLGVTQLQVQFVGQD